MRLVADVLDERSKAKLAKQQRIGQPLGSLNEASAVLAPVDEASLRALGEDFALVWTSEACPMTLKRRITRTLMREIVVHVTDAQQLNMVIHWQGGLPYGIERAPAAVRGGCTQDRARPDDLEPIKTMARRYGDDEIPRVSSKLQRRTDKGNRWTQARVATVRRKRGMTLLKRWVTNLPDGIKTVTESDDPSLAQAIKARVASMSKRLGDGREFNIFSTTLPVIFDNAGEIKSVIEMTDKGAIVTRTATDANVVAALQARVGEVNELVRDGMSGMRRGMMARMAMGPGGPRGAKANGTNQANRAAPARQHGH